ncbi:hypothetical protein ACFYYS_06215 [Streptomyces sp. NPDC002120]|uniref:hypothetical protein n=1 Tax=Streptomyces sp. NPDC002120 TaxID=3364631 RepID=UPI003697ADCD
MATVAFMNGKKYPARDFRRWFGAQQDGVKGFVSDSFKVTMSGSSASIKPGVAFAREAEYGTAEQALYQITEDQTRTETVANGFLWMFPLDAVDHEQDLLGGEGAGDQHVRFQRTQDRTAPNPRALLLAHVEGGVAKDMRTAAGTGQFYFTRSGPARLGAPMSPEVPAGDLAALSLGTQYTNLSDGVRYVKIGTAGTLNDWARDQGPQGKQGPKGDQGATGPQGERGDTGRAGDLGDLTTGYEHDIKVIGGKTVLLDSLDVKSMLNSHERSIADVLDKSSDYEGRIKGLEDKVRDLAGKVRLGVYARTSGWYSSQWDGRSRAVYWDYSGNRTHPPVGFTMSSDGRYLTCQTPGTYALTAHFLIDLSYATDSTRVTFNVGGSQTTHSVDTEGGQPSATRVVEIRQGQQVSVSIAASRRFGADNRSALSITPAF